MGLIGCGNIWRSVYQPILASLKGRVEVTAFCDRLPSTAQGMALTFPDARFYTDPDALFRKESLDAAIVLTTEKANAPIALAALQAGLHVYQEKPPAVSVAEWSGLAEAAEVEAQAGRGQLYTAFNRRHTPLFRDWRLPEGDPLRKVKGVLLRSERDVPSFPFTAVHVIDSAQYFAGSLLAKTQVHFGQGDDGAFWKITGRFENGAECELTFIPDGTHSEETLVFETDEQIRELHFPNRSHLENRDGLLVSKPLNPKSGGEERISGVPSDDFLLAMGFTSCFRDFLEHLENGTMASSPHRLHRCGPVVRVLEEMLAAAR